MRWCIFVAVFCLFRVAECVSEEKLETTINQQRSFKRLTWNGQEAPTRFDFDDDAYVQGVSTAALVGVVIGVIALVWGFCWGMCRCISNDSKGLVYSSGQRLWPKFALIPIAMVVAIGAALAYRGESDFTPSVAAFMDDLTIATEKRLEAAIATTTLIQSLNNVTSGRQVVLNRLLTLQAEEDVNYVLDSKRDAVNLNKQRVDALQVSVAFAIAALVCGFISALIKSGFFGYLMVFLSFLCLFLNWGSFGVHYSGSILIADLCFELKDFGTVNLTQSGAGDSITPPFVRCLPFTSTKNLYTLTTIRGAESLNVTSRAYPSQPVFPPVNANNVPAILTILDGLSPPGPQVAASKKWMTAVTDMNGFVECVAVKNAFAAVRTKYCYDWIITLRQIIAGNGIIAIIMIFGTYIGVLAADRFGGPPKRKKKKKKDGISHGAVAAGAVGATAAAAATGSYIMPGQGVRVSTGAGNAAGRHLPSLNHNKNIDYRFSENNHENNNENNNEENEEEEMDVSEDEGVRPLPPLRVA